MAEIIVGSRVRVKDPHSFIRAVEKKLTNRVGTVLKIWQPDGWRKEPPFRVKVEFDARRKGSPTYTDTFGLRDLDLADEVPGLKVEG